MNSKGLFNKFDNENDYNEKPMLPDNQPYTSNPDGYNLPNNTFEQNNTPLPNHLTTPVETPNNPEQNQTNQYDINQDMETFYRNRLKRSEKCLKYMLLVMSILMFIFLISEYFILSSKDLAFKNIYIIIDDAGILIIAIIFLVSFILSINGLKEINPIARTIITSFVWFVGCVIRGIGNSMLNTFDNAVTLFVLLVIRSFLLFFCVPVSFNNNPQIF